MNKQDPRIIKTRRQIDEALLENLAQYDFQKITVDMLCKSALVNRSTFYKYYKDKYDLLDQYLDRIIQEFRQAFGSTDFILATPYTIDERKYKDNFHKSAEFFCAHKDVYRTLWNARIERNVFREMTSVITHNIIRTLAEAGDRTPTSLLYQHLYCRLFAENLMTLMYWWLDNEDQVSLSEVEKIMNSNMKNGMFTTFKNRL